MKIKTFLINLLIFLIFFICIDVLFSNFFFKYRVGYKCYDYNEEGTYYKLGSNCYAKMRLVASIDSYHVYTNENGNRYSGKEKKINNKTIFFFGDSFTFGLGSNWEDTYVGILENKLNSFDLYNFGVPSYSPTVYRYQLQQILKEQKLRPEKVFVMLDLTDVSDEGERWSYVDKDATPKTKERKFKELTPFKKFKRNNFKASHLIANFLRDTSRKIRKKIKKENHSESVYKPVDGNPAGGFVYTDFRKLTGCDTEQKKYLFWTCGGVSIGLENMKNQMKSFGKLTEQIDADLYLIVFPWPDTLNFGQTVFSWEDYADELCKISNCNKVINLFPEFKKVKSAKKSWLEYLYLPNDIHFTREGNEIVANKIFKEAFNN